MNTIFAKFKEFKFTQYEFVFLKFILNTQTY